MPTPSLSDLYFDEDDGNLFLVEDLRLRADALKHSVLPRLQRVLHSAIGEIRDVLGIEVLAACRTQEFKKLSTFESA